MRAEIRTGPFALSSFWPNPSRILQYEFPLGRRVVEKSHQQVLQVRSIFHPEFDSRSPREVYEPVKILLFRTTDTPEDGNPEEAVGAGLP